MNALLLVDIQSDFLPGGALAVENGDEVIPVANDLIPHFDLVIATQDWHPPSHGSFASQNEGVNIGELFELDGLQQIAWPDHCLQNTLGAELAEQLNTDAIQHVFQKGTNQNIDSYSGFFDNDHRQSTGLGDFLKQQQVDEVFVMGLATDYCVKYTTLDAIALGFKAVLIEDGCRGVDLRDGDVEDAINEMKTAGATLINSQAVLKTNQPNQKPEARQ